MKGIARTGAVLAALAALAVVPATAGAASFTVTTNAASGAGSLAAAIAAANAAAGADSIGFDAGFFGSAAPSNQRTITLTTANALPDITGPVTIDGRVQGGGAQVAPLVRVTGPPTGADAAGLHLTAGAAGSAIRGLSITRFNTSGIVVDAPNTTITATYVGVGLSGTGPGVGNDHGGIIVNASGVTIGGTTAGQANVIGDNHRCGIVVQNGAGTVVRGNLIGTEASGLAVLGNAQDASCGVRVQGTATGTVIGGSTAGAGGVVPGNTTGNVISGNDLDGVEIVGGAGTVVQGNLIGLGGDGATVLANTLAGVLVSGGTGTVIGGRTAAEGNVVSGNFHGPGLWLGAPARVEGNRVGVGADGLTVLSNHDGVLVTGPGVVVGGAAAGAGNLISGNNATGVTLTSGAVGAQVLGNQIGGGTGGNSSVAANQGAQVLVSGTASGSTIAFNTVIDVAGTGPIRVTGTGAGTAVRANRVRLGGTPTALDLGAAGITPALTPTLSSVLVAGDRTQVQGTFTGAPSSTYALDLYTDAACGPLHRAMDRFVGTTSITTAADGTAAINATVAGTVTPGEHVLATATGPDGATHELGPCADAGAAPTLQLAADTYAGGERAGVVRVTVERLGGGDASAGIRLRTVDGTAVAGVNYTAQDRYVTINAGQTSATLDIPVVDDERRPGPRTFTVQAYGPNAAVLGARTVATVTIADDGVYVPPPSAAVVRILAPGGTLSRSAARLVRGNVTGGTVKRVQVAVTRSGCRRLGGDGRLHARTSGSTCEPTWLTAKGTGRWSRRLPRLPAGRYVISARAIDAAGLITTVRTVSVRLR